MLEVDALFLTAARSLARRARIALSRIRPLTRRLDRLQERMDALDAWEDADEFTSLAIQMEGAYSELAAAVTPVLRLCAQTHVNAAAALEANINRRVLKHLRKAPDVSDVLWLGLPERVQELLRRKGAKPFEEKSPPFPELKALVSTRNALVHYKPRRLPVPETRLPKLPKRLGLEPGIARKSVDTVEKVIAQISERLEEEVPHWVTHSAYSVFSYELD